MAEAFIYMFVVGAGTSLGVATIGFISWKVVIRSNNKTTRKMKKSGAY